MLFKANAFSFQINVVTIGKLLSYSLSVVFTSNLQGLSFRLVCEAQNIKSSMLPTILREVFAILVYCVPKFVGIFVFVFVVHLTTNPWLRPYGMKWKRGWLTMSLEGLRRDLSWYYPEFSWTGFGKRRKISHNQILD